MTKPVTEPIKNPQETVLVFAPHPDDEVLGVGGTIASLAAQGHRVVVCITSKGQARHFSPEQVETVRQRSGARPRAFGGQRNPFFRPVARRLSGYNPTSRGQRSTRRGDAKGRPDHALSPLFRRHSPRPSDYL